VDISCTADIGGETYECGAIPDAESVDDCDVVVQYLYTVSNVGPTTETISSLIIGRDGVTRDLVGSLSDLVLEPDGNTTAVENESVDICEFTTFTTSAEVNASPPEGEPCMDVDSYEFVIEPLCEVEVGIECTAVVDGVAYECRQIPKPEEAEDCVVSAVYTYTVSNVGPTTETITSLTVTQDGVSSDLIDGLNGTVLDPSSIAEVSVGWQVDLCSGDTFTTNADVVATSPADKTCESTDAYSFTPSADCEVDVDISCTADIGGETYECGAIPDAESVDDCDVVVQYLYTVSNVGPTTETISSLIIGRDGVTRDLVAPSPAHHGGPVDSLAFSGIPSVTVGNTAGV